MRAVGVRELKNKLSEYLRLVGAGEEILVTDHGRVVAEIRRPGIASVNPTGVDLLVERGLARPGGPNSADLYPRLEPCGPEGLSRRLLDEERGER
jgi:antitoxin (DNA-binding transcriptional repressor) of toxin-antitoxin stability system